MQPYKFISKQEIDMYPFINKLEELTNLKIRYEKEKNKITITGKTSLIIGGIFNKIGSIHLEYCYNSKNGKYEYSFYRKNNGHYLLYHFIWALSALGYIEIKPKVMDSTFPIVYEKVPPWVRLVSRTYLKEVGQNIFQLYARPEYYR